MVAPPEEAVEPSPLSSTNLGLRRVMVCHVDSTLLVWLQGRADASTPGGLGDALVQAVVEGLPTLQAQKAPPDNLDVDGSGDGVERGRAIACALDSDLAQLLAEVAGDQTPAAVSATAVAAVAAAKRSRGGRRRTRKRPAAAKRTAATKARTAAKSGTKGQQATSAAATAAAASASAQAATAEPLSATQKSGASPSASDSSGAAPKSKSRSPRQARAPRPPSTAKPKRGALLPLDPEIAAELAAGQPSSPALRALRISLGYSQAAAASSLGVSRGLLADAERGRRSGEQTLARLTGGLLRVREEAEQAAAGQPVAGDEA